MSNKVVTDEEIQKALDVLKGGKSDDIEKGQKEDLSEIDKQILELQAKKQALEKGAKNDLGENSLNTDEIVKAVSEELGSKFESFANISKSLMDENAETKKQNEELVKINQELQKSVTENSDLLKKAIEQIDQMANTPIGKLGAFTKATQVERFKTAPVDGKETLSLSGDRKKILGLLEKGLETKEGCERLAPIIGLIENRYVTEDNFTHLKKSVENELGSNFNITF